MLESIKIVNVGESQWRLELRGKSYSISKADSGIMDILKPSGNQVCVITDLTSENAVCYFVVEDGYLKVYSLPDNRLRVQSKENIKFFQVLNEGTKYYLIPV